MYDIYIKKNENNLLWFEIGPYEFYIKHNQDYGEKTNTYWCLSHADFYSIGSGNTMRYEQIFFESHVNVDPFQNALIAIRNRFARDLPISVIDLTYSINTDGIYIPEPHMRK